MSRSFTTGGWRRVVGLIAAYALALNVILTGFAAHAAFDPNASVDPFSVICSSAAGGHAPAATDDGSKGTAPVDHGCGHCALCGCSPSAVPPHQVFLNLQFIRSDDRLRDAVRVPAAGHNSLPGQPRAPPQAA